MWASTSPPNVRSRPTEPKTIVSAMASTMDGKISGERSTSSRMARPRKVCRTIAYAANPPATSEIMVAISATAALSRKDLMNSAREMALANHLKVKP